MSSIRSRLTYANVMSSLAFFIALTTGGAYAADTIGSSDIIDESILSQDIKNTEVKTADIAGAAVTNSKLGPNAVGSGKILDGNVATADLANDAVTSEKIAADAVTSGTLAPDSVGGAEIRANSISSSDIGPSVVGAADLEQIHEHPGTLTNITSDGIAHDGSYVISSASVSCGVDEDLLGVSVRWSDSGGHNERHTVGVSSINRLVNPDTATVEVSYDGGATTAVYQPVATCIS